MGKYILLVFAVRGFYKVRHFSLHNIDELKQFLLTSNIHDGYFDHAIFDEIKKEYFVCVKNAVWNGSIKMSFCGVDKFVSDNSAMWSSNENINGLAIIDNAHKLPVYINADDCIGKMCFVWEMFSGRLVYIVCSEMRASTTEDSRSKGQGDGSLS